MKRRDTGTKGGRGAGTTVGLTNLYRAFVEITIRDLASPGTSRDAIRYRLEAQAWLEDIHADGPFSLTGVAGWIGCEPLALARRIRQEAQAAELAARRAQPFTTEEPFPSFPEVLEMHPDYERGLEAPMRTDRSDSTQAWRDAISREVANFRKLEPAADPWSPDRPSERAVDKALALLRVIRVENLPAAMASTGPDGVICFEWRKPDRAVSFYVFEDGRVEVYAMMPNRAPVDRDIEDRLEQVNDFLWGFVR